MNHNPISSFIVLNDLNRDLTQHQDESGILACAAERIYELTAAPFIYGVFKHRLDDKLEVALYYKDGKQQHLDEPDNIRREIGEHKLLRVIQDQRSLYFGSRAALEAYEREQLGQEQQEEACWLGASWFGVPMNAIDRTLGALVIRHDSEEDAYSEEVRDVLELIADAVARAIDYERLNKRFKILVKLERQLNQSTAKTQSDLLKEIHDYLSHETDIDIDHLSIITRDKFKQGLRVIVSWGQLIKDKAEQENRVNDYNEDLIQKIIQSQQPYVQCPEGLIEFDSKNIKNAPKSSWVGVPMRIRNHSIGVFIVKEPNLENPEYVFNGNDVEFLDTLSDKVANAIHYVQDKELYQVLADVERALIIKQNALTREEIFAILEENASHVADLYNLCVFEKNEESDDFNLVCAYRKNERVLLEDNEDSKVAQTIQDIEVYAPKDLLQQIVDERKPLRFNTGQSFKEAFDADPDREYPKSWLGVPMRTQNEALGVFVVYHKQLENVYDESDERFLDDFSDCVALAWEKIGLTEQRIKDLENIGDIYSAVCRQSSLEDVFKQILEFVVAQTGADYADLWVYDGSKIYFKKGHEYKRVESLEFISKVLNGDNPPGILGQVIQQQLEYYCPDVSQDSYYLSASDDVQSEFAIPLRFQDEIIGILNLESCEKDAFPEDTRSVVKAGCESAAIAIKVYQLQKQVNKLLEKKDSQMAVSFEILQRILDQGVSFDASEVANFIQEKASVLMDVGNMYFVLYDSDSDEISFKVVYVNGELQDPYPSRKLSQGRGKTEAIIRTQKSIRHTAEESAKWYKDQGVDYVGQHYDCPWLGVPILLKGIKEDEDKCLGVIATYSTGDQGHIYTEEDQFTLEQLAEWTAIALENTKLIRKVADQEAVLTRSLIAQDFVHQMNSLAGTIPIWLDLLKLEIESISELDRVKCNEYIENSQTDLRYLLDRVQELKKPAVHYIYNVDEIIKLRIRYFEVLYAEDISKGVLFIKHELDNSGCYIQGVYATIVNSFDAIIQNAIDAILAKGKGELIIRTFCDSGFNHIKITDNGIGLSKEKQTEVFTPFFSTKAKGTGYGLWRAKLIFEKMGGSIRFESEENIQTIVEVKLPIVQAKN